MSWETYLTAWLEFNERAEKGNIKEKILKEFAEVCCCEPVWDECFKAWHFEDINWTSHVEGRKIAEVFEKWKDYLFSFSASVWYLTEPHEYIEYQENVPEEENIVDVY